ncbi:MAG: SDR family oxidoreductase [Actinomycetota bacterium]|nr:SDR family oxidoreductase [Actinomycetota bacterium]
MPETRGTALITGPTSGIGRSFARALSAAGYDLVLVARDEPRLEELAAQLRALHAVGVEVMVADLSDRASLATVESRLSDGSRPVDLLVNNAGFALKAPFLDQDVEQEQLMLDVLVTAVLRLSHAAVRPMAARRHGAIVNVASFAGFVPRGSYGAAKAYVVSLSQWLDLAYRGQGVRAMALCPGLVRTEFHQRMGVARDSAPGWMWLDADRLVGDALADLERGRRISIPSRRYKLLAMVVRCTPASLQSRLQTLGRR